VPSIDVRERHVSWRRLLAGGIIATALVAMGGGGLELWWFGASDAAAGQRAERDIQRRFDAMVRAVTQVSERVGSNPAAVTGLSASTDNARPLFDLAREARRTSEAADQGTRIQVRFPRAVLPSEMISINFHAVRTPVGACSGSFWPAVMKMMIPSTAAMTAMSPTLLKPGKMSLQRINSLIGGNVRESMPRYS